MKIILNGEKFDGLEGQNLAELVADQAPTDRRVAVLYNGQVVTADRWGTIHLAADDRVDLVTLAPGG